MFVVLFGWLRVKYPRKRFLWVLLAISALVVFCVLPFVLSNSELDRFNHLRIGMTEQEVEKSFDLRHSPALICNSMQEEEYRTYYLEICRSLFFPGYGAELKFVKKSLVSKKLHEPDLETIWDYWRQSLGMKSNRKPPPFVPDL